MVRMNRATQRKLRLAQLCVAGVAITFLFLAWLHPYAFRTTLSYVTRPAWDTLIYPSAPIINLATDTLFENQKPDYICGLHKTTPRKGNVRLWDAIIFSHELDMLEIHLAELYDVVDQFIIMESTVTYSGQPKALHYKEHEKRFKRFEEKILYSTFDTDVAGFSTAPGSFAIETEQRNHMTGIINDLYRTAGPAETLVLVADVDEIPYDHTLRLIKTCSLPPILHLELIPFIYSFEWVSGDLDSWHIQMHTWDPQTSYYKHSSKSTEDYITYAGVHCSFCFAKISDFQWKMKAYSHNDRLGDHPKALLLPDRIQKAVCKGENIFGMLPEAYTWWDLITRWKGHLARRQTAHPAWFRRNPNDSPTFYLEAVNDRSNKGFSIFGITTKNSTSHCDNLIVTSHALMLSTGCFATMRKPTRLVQSGLISDPSTGGGGHVTSLSVKRRVPCKGIRLPRQVREAEY